MNRLLLLIAFFLSFSKTSAQEIHPYLQAVTTNSVYVNWLTKNLTETTVEYGTAKDNLNITVTGSYNAFQDITNNYHYHTAKLVNLQPNTKYYYRVKSASRVSEIKAFKTLPKPGQASTADGKIRFLILGDNQLRNAARFDSLVASAKRKIHEKWGYDKDVADNIAMTVMVGDQVDTGTLDHYEHVHFAKNKELSGELPVQTLIGNHETYGILGTQGYKNHFVLDEMEYKGIKSNTENYFARQAGNVLFIGFDTEYTSNNGNDQLAWLNQLLEAANSDSTVDWIISLGHRPYQAEQYVGDISQWIRNTAVPLLSTSDKFVLHIGAHHHLYSRGQLRDNKAYHIISGGTAWDQYWGMSSEADFDDVQKTIPNWIYQIIEIDVPNKTFDLEAYSIGSKNLRKDNELMDKFHRQKNKPAPAKPSITNTFTANVELPLTLNSSEFISSSGESLNSTQFQISKTETFTPLIKDVYRDFENLYGKADNRIDSSADVHSGMDITKLELAKNSLSNGKYFVKVRHRDQNLEWSPWSETTSFSVINSTVANSGLTLDKKNYALTDNMTINYTGGSSNPNAWIGVYDPSQTPGAAGTANHSWAWEYTGGKSEGTIIFKNIGTTNGNVKYGLEPGRYYAAMFKDGGYTQIAPKQYFYVGSIPVLSTDKENYENDASVLLTYSDAPKLNGDKIAIFKVGKDYANSLPAKEITITAATATETVTGLAPGYYYAEYFVQNSDMVIGERTFFKVGNLVTNLMLNKPQYKLGETIVASWTDAPGIAKDWIGIYKKGDDPNTDSTEDSGYSYTYFDGLPEGQKNIGENELPKTVGEWFAVIFTNDSYNEISNRVTFEVIDSGTLSANENQTRDDIRLFPNPTTQSQATYIESKYPIQKIELFDMSGKLLYATQNVNQNKFSLINHQLPKGAYIIAVHSRKVFTYKLIIK